MTDIPSIVTAYRCHSDQRGAIATVVKTEGSSYRRPGARMLIFDREVIGSISGGCLEQDVIAHAQEVMRSGQPRLVTYDSTAKEDIVWGLGLGCNGVVQILIERLHAHHSLTLIETGLATQNTSVLATVFNAEGNGEIAIGTSLLLTDQTTIQGNFPESNWKRAVIADALSALDSQQPTTLRYQSPDAQFIEVLIEILQPPVDLWLFGAGQDAVPVAHLAKTLGWSVTLVDCRALAATAQRFSGVDRVILTRRDQIEELTVPPGAIAVVMTHHYLDDLAILKMLLPSQAQYVGLLGSRLRANRLLDECVALTPEQQSRCYAPIGLDIGAETPEAIALSIVAEIQAVLARRSAGHLKHRQAGIHVPVPHQERSEVLGSSLISGYCKVRVPLAELEDSRIQLAP
jgi:xanthine/CO dehydrogenase XdhC/CoxF family maturation factor